MLHILSGCVIRTMVVKVLGQTHERAGGRIWTLLITESEVTTDFSPLGSELLSQKRHIHVPNLVFPAMVWFPLHSHTIDQAAATPFGLESFLLLSLWSRKKWMATRCFSGMGEEFPEKAFYVQTLDYRLYSSLRPQRQRVAWKKSLRSP